MSSHNIGGRSYPEPAKNIARINAKTARQAGQRREMHNIVMTLSEHIPNCPTCSSRGPSLCPLARDLRSLYLVIEANLET